jgi:hypothetical protein
MGDDERDIDDVVDELAAQRWKRGEREPGAATSMMLRWTRPARSATRPAISSNNGRNPALVSTRPAQIASSGAIKVEALRVVMCVSGRLVAFKLRGRLERVWSLPEEVALVRAGAWGAGSCCRE